MSTIKLRNRLAGQAAIAPLPTASAGEPYFNVVGWTGNGPNSLWIDDGVNLVPLVDNTRQVELAGAQAITGLKTITGAGRIIFAAITNMEVVGGVAGEAILKGPGNTLVWGTGGIPDAPVDTFMYGRQDAAWARSVAVAGDTMTGNLVFATQGGGIVGPDSAGLTAGVLNITGGAGSAIYAGGQVHITGGDAIAGSNSFGGHVILRGGVGDGTSIGGAVQIYGSDSLATPGSRPGGVTVKPGTAMPGSGSAGGDVSITGGAGDPASGNVSIVLRGGVGTAGNFYITDLRTTADAVNPEAVWNNNGFLNIGRGGTVPPIYTFGTGLTDTAGTITLNQATQAVFGGGLIATNPNIAAGTLDTVLLTPLGLRSQLGADAATLVTTAKTVVPAINEIFNDITQLVGVVIFAGTYDATTSTGTFNGQGGIAAGAAPLPVAATANHGAYVIVTVAGPGGGTNEPAGAIGIGDWLLSDGGAWIKMPFSQAPITAANIAVNPLVLGADDVQEALENLAAASTAAGFYDPTTFTGDALSSGRSLSWRSWTEAHSEGVTP